jgi:hypothetical protein
MAAALPPSIISLRKHSIANFAGPPLRLRASVSAYNPRQIFTAALSAGPNRPLSQRAGMNRRS